jgi:hypothetical protein
LFIRDAHPLAVQCQNFCGRFTAALEPETRLPFLEFAFSEFSKADWAARRMIAPLAGSVVSLLSGQGALFIHTVIRARLNDPVRTVIVGILTPLAKLRQLWELKGEEELERDIIEMFDIVRNTKDELLLAAWNDAWESSAMRGNVSSLPKLPQSATRAELNKKPTPLKSVASLQSAVRKPAGLLGLGAGKARRRIFQAADSHGETVAAASYSGPGLMGPRLTEPGLSMIGGVGGTVVVAPGIGGGRRVERIIRGGRS